MKKLLIALLLFVRLTSLSQTDQGSYTIFNDRSYSQVNAYASFDGSVFNVNSSPTGSVGGTFAITVNHAFSIGATGAYVIESKNEPQPILVIPSGYNNYVIKRYFWYLGIMLEPTLLPRAPIHLTFPIVIGGGQRSYRLQETHEMWNYYAISLSKESFFIASIGIRAEVNIADGFRISVGPSYKYVTRLTILSGPSIDVSIKVGSF